MSRDSVGTTRRQRAQVVLAVGIRAGDLTHRRRHREEPRHVGVDIQGELAAQGQHPGQHPVPLEAFPVVAGIVADDLTEVVEHGQERVPGSVAERGVRHDTVRG